MRNVLNELSDGFVRYADGMTPLCVNIHYVTMSVPNSPRTRTKTETKSAKNKDLASPLPWTISDHSSRDLCMDMMPRPAKETLMSTKSKSPALLDLERLMRGGFER